MKITDFKIGDKIMRLRNEDGLIYMHKISNSETMLLTFEDLLSHDWEYYKETKKEKKRETFYEVVTKRKGNNYLFKWDKMFRTESEFFLYMDLDENDYQFINLINPIEAEYE